MADLHDSYLLNLLIFLIELLDPPDSPEPSDLPESREIKQNILLSPVLISNTVYQITTLVLQNVRYKWLDTKCLSYCVTSICFFFAQIFLLQQ